jgi:hypothetical protein
MSPQAIARLSALGYMPLTIEEQPRFTAACLFFENHLLTIGIENLPRPSSPSPDRFYLTYLLTADPAVVYRYELEMLEQYRRFLETN